MKKKILSVLLAVALVLSFNLVMAMPAAAKGPVGETVTVLWLEDASRYSPDDSLLSSWTNDTIGPADLVRTGKAYHFASIQEYYNYPGLENLSGSLVISGAGKLSGHAKYTSPAKPGINWPMVGGIIGGVIVVALLIFLFVRRRE